MPLLRNNKISGTANFAELDPTIMDRP